MEAFQAQTHIMTDFVNHQLEGIEAWKVALGSFTAALAVSWLYNQLTHKTPLTKRLKKRFFRLVRSLPMVQNKLQEEMSKTRGDFEKEMTSAGAHLNDILALPETGHSKQAIMDLTKTYMGLGEFDWTKGTQSGTVYNGNPDLTSLMTEVYGMAAWTNPLHPDTFPGIRKMEAEVVRMCCTLFNGGPGTWVLWISVTDPACHGSFFLAETCGTVTTGGTESIVLAVKTYRDYAREVMGISDPVIVSGL